MITRYDKGLMLTVALFSSILFVLNLSVFNAAAGDKPKEAAIFFDRGKTTLELSRDAKVALEGPLGETIIETSDNRIHVLSSPCPNQDCVHKGWISKSHQAIICAPNRIVIRILGRSEEEVDALNG